METEPRRRAGPRRKTARFSPLCGKATNFFGSSRKFDAFPGGKGEGAVENPVENVDNSARLRRGTEIILGYYVTRNLSLVVGRERVSNCNFSVEMPKGGKYFLLKISLCSGNFRGCLL